MNPFNTSAAALVAVAGTAAISLVGAGTAQASNASVRAARASCLRGYRASDRGPSPGGAC